MLNKKERSSDAMTINSISENRSSIYQTSKNSAAASTHATQSNTNELYGLDETKTAKDAAIAENYSAAEHLVMMQSAKGTLKYTIKGEEDTTEAGDISSIDADGDGTISTDEYETMITQMGIQNALSAEEFFEQYDSNSDGEISSDEMPEPGTVGTSSPAAATQPMTAGLPPIEIEEETLSKYDTDGDGVLSAAEFSAMMEALRPDDTDDTATQTVASSSTDTRTNQLENMNKLLLAALEQYEENYKSMFETLEGTELNSLA